MDLTRVRSDAIRWVIERAAERGNRFVLLADWPRAPIARMQTGAGDSQKAEVTARWPGLAYYIEAGTRHSEPDEGSIEDGFAVSFPRPKPTQRID
ncbi:MAG: hypothetical protein WEA77_12290 [Hyphomonas sp.]|uniref:hypothetical protein n=1 Tax=Hyphomonas sp. TaxID=87 RepID=UPI00349FDE12